MKPETFPTLDSEQTPGLDQRVTGSESLQPEESRHRDTKLDYVSVNRLPGARRRTDWGKKEGEEEEEEKEGGRRKNGAKGRSKKATKIVVRKKEKGGQRNAHRPPKVNIVQCNSFHLWACSG